MTDGSAVEKAERVWADQAAKVTRDAVNLHGGGNGGNDGGMNDRIAKLESDMENIKGTLSEMKQDIRELRSDAKSDFRVLFGALIAVALGLAGLMAKGFNWL